MRIVGVDHFEDGHFGSHSLRSFQLGNVNEILGNWSGEVDGDRTAAGSGGPAMMASIGGSSGRSSGLRIEILRGEKRVKRD